MIQIEILSEDGIVVTAAFYYEIPFGQQLLSAEDQNRTPAGTSLSAQELQDLKDGKIFEVIWSSGATGLNTAARRSKLVSEWAQNQGDAKAEYKSVYGASGDYYDGQWNEA